MTYDTLSPNELRVKAQLCLAGKSAAQNLFFRNAWDRVNATIHANAKRGTKVFEVHHLFETARRAYFIAMLGGADAPTCEQLAIAAVMPTSPQRATDAEIREDLRNEVANTGDC